MKGNCHSLFFALSLYSLNEARARYVLIVDRRYFFRCSTATYVPYVAEGAFESEAERERDSIKFVAKMFGLTSVSMIPVTITGSMLWAQCCRG